MKTHEVTMRGFGYRLRIRWRFPAPPRPIAGMLIGVLIVALTP